MVQLSAPAFQERPAVQIGGAVGLGAKRRDGVQDKLRKSPRQQRSRHLVEAVLDATARILARDGYDKVNTNLVATVAGVSIGSLYQYFPNKEALVAAVVERHGERLHAAIVTGFGLTPPATLEDAVQRIVGSVAAVHRVEPELHAVLEGEMPRLELFDGHHATICAIGDVLRGLPTTLGITIPDPDRAAHMIGEMVHALIHAAMIPPVSNVLRPDEIERETSRAVLAYLTALSA